MLQFYERVNERLVRDLKVPFQLVRQQSLFRKDDTLVHEAIREALVNALLHADYQGIGGIVIEKHRDRLEFRNPGTLLLSREEILRGGTSECRNRTLQRMFSYIGYGERAGSGLDKIRQGWASQKWRAPDIEESPDRNRVTLTMPMVSLLPDDAVEQLRERLGRRFGELAPLEVQALVTAEVEHGVSNSRMQLLCSEHPTDITKLLQRLVTQGLLVQVGKKRGTSYCLPALPHGRADFSHTERDSSRKGDNSSHKEEDSSRNVEEDSAHKPMELSEASFAALQEIAAPVSSSRRLPPYETRAIILRLCEGRYLQAALLGSLMKRNANSLRNRFLTPMVAEALLSYRYPNEPTRPDQAYTTVKR